VGAGWQVGTALGAWPVQSCCQKQRSWSAIVAKRSCPGVATTPVMTGCSLPARKAVALAKVALQQQARVMEWAVRVHGCYMVFCSWPLLATDQGWLSLPLLLATPASCNRCCLPTQLPGSHYSLDQGWAWEMSRCSIAPAQGWCEPCCGQKCTRMGRLDERTSVRLASPLMLLEDGCGLIARPQACARPAAIRGCEVTSYERGHAAQRAGEGRHLD
jgi:hypothetical protein